MAKVKYADLIEAAFGRIEMTELNATIVKDPFEIAALSILTIAETSLLTFLPDPAQADLISLTILIIEVRE